MPIRRLLDRLGAATPAVRVAAAAAVVPPLKTMLAQVRAMLQAGPVSLESLPRALVDDWTTRDGRARLLVLPHDDRDNAALLRFMHAVKAVAPDATGWPIFTSASGDSVIDAFLQAGAYSFFTILLLLASTAYLWHTNEALRRQLASRDHPAPIQKQSEPEAGASKGESDEDRQRRIKEHLELLSLRGRVAQLTRGRKQIAGRRLASILDESICFERLPQSQRAAGVDARPGLRQGP